NKSNFVASANRFRKLGFMFFKRLYQLGFKLCDARVAASAEAGGDLFGECYQVVHCGVYMTKLERQACSTSLRAPVRLTTVGSLLPVKNQAFLLDVCAGLKEHNLEYKLNIIGVGPLREELEAKAA